MKLASDLQERSFLSCLQKERKKLLIIIIILAYFNRDLPMVSLDPYQNKESTPTRVECGRVSAMVKTKATSRVHSYCRGCNGWGVSK